MLSLVWTIPSQEQGTDCVFSPDEQVIMTGVSVRKGEVKRPCVSISFAVEHIYTVFFPLQGKG